VKLFAELYAALDATNASTVWATHGFRAPLVRRLFEHRREAVAVDARYQEAEQ
jgi:hypothetical protein